MAFSAKPFITIVDGIFLPHSRSLPIVWKNLRPRRSQRALHIRIRGVLRHEHGHVGGMQTHVEQTL